MLLATLRAVNHAVRAYALVKCLVDNFPMVEASAQDIFLIQEITQTKFFLILDS